MRIRCGKCGGFAKDVDHAVCPVINRNGSKNPRWAGGKASHPYYFLYLDMIARCSRTTHSRYKDYGGRGITVCDEWRQNFWTFVTDMGPRPDNFVLDRVDNDGNYEPSNCRWTDYSTSAKNRRMDKLLARPRNEKGQYF